MATPDISSVTGNLVPSWTSFFTFQNVIIVLILGSIFAVVLFGGVFWWLWKRRYNKKFEIWKTINGRTSRIAVWKAWIRRIGTANDYWSEIWWRKEILPRPKK